MNLNELIPGYVYKVKEGSSPIRSNNINHSVFYLISLEDVNKCSSYPVVRLCFLSKDQIVKNTWANKPTMEACQYERVE
jgi:hypothetical protein